MEYHTPEVVCDHPNCEEWAHDTHELQHHILFLCPDHGDKWSIIETLEDISKTREVE